MTKAIPPGRAHTLARAFEIRITRIRRHTNPAIRALHDNQPGYPSTNTDGGRGGGGHSDPTGNLAFAPDPARATLDEVSTLFDTIDQATIRLDHLLRNWAGPSKKWQDALASEAAEHLGDDRGWCIDCRSAGTMTPARTENAARCRWHEDIHRDLGVPAPQWLTDRHLQGRRISTEDIARAKRERKKRRKAKR